MAKRSPKPQGTSWIAPLLIVKDIDQALAFYQQAFGFEKRFSMPGPDGKSMYGEMLWQDSSFMLGPEKEGHPAKAPATTGTPSPVGLYVYCPDVDALYKRATGAGAKGLNPPQDMFWGDRWCTLSDPNGHSWHFATNVAEFDPAKAPNCSGGTSRKQC